MEEKINKMGLGKKNMKKKKDIIDEKYLDILPGEVKYYFNCLNDII